MHEPQSGQVENRSEVARQPAGGGPSRHRLPSKPAGDLPVPPVNAVLRSLGAQLPSSAAPAQLGAPSAPAERRAEAAARGADGSPDLPAHVRLHRSSDVDDFAGVIGAEAFTVGHDVFLGSDAGDDTLAHELSHAADSESVHAPTIRRKGVKQALAEGDRNFKVFSDSTNATRAKYDEVASAIYNAYKPGAQIFKKPKNAMDVEQDEATSDVGSSGQATVGANPFEQLWSDEGRQDKYGASPKVVRGVSEGLGGDEASGRRRQAQALRNWSATAADSGERIYEELRAVTGLIDQEPPTSGLSYDMIHAGVDTKSDPDFAVKKRVGTKKADIALESKYITSANPSAVPGHLDKAAQQLQKRDAVRRVGHIGIAEEANQWGEGATDDGLSSMLRGQMKADTDPIDWRLNLGDGTARTRTVDSMKSTRRSTRRAESDPPVTKKRKLDK